MAEVGYPIRGKRFLAIAEEEAKKSSSLIGAQFSKELREALASEKRFEGFQSQDEVQNGAIINNLRKARLLAAFLINDQGELDQARLKEAIAYLKEHGYPLGCFQEYEAPFQKHFIKVLQTLQENREAFNLLRGMGKPLQYPYAEQLIRDSILLPRDAQVTDAHSRRAALSAWLCSLRQGVGSCFATAPAILIQGEQPLRFLADLKELLNLGRLKRTFGGVEYTVPLSPSWGLGSLRKPVFVDAHGTKLAVLPNFICALESAGLIDRALARSEKEKISRNLVKAVLQSQSPPYKGGLLTGDQLLQAVLLKENELSAADLEKNEAPPRDLLQAQLLFQMEGRRNNKSSQRKTGSVERFQTQLKAAQNGFKSLSNHALLRTWEFSLASFAETKAEFFKWNLYASLGMQIEQPHSVAELIYRNLNQKLKELKHTLAEIQSNYERSFLELRALESRIKQSTSEQQARWLKVDFEMRFKEYDILADRRDELNEKAKRISELYRFLLSRYDSKFPAYFQEIYDAEMQEMTVRSYEDSPAGFRLICKHGRTNPAAWTLIYTSGQFIDALVEFFTATEHELVAEPELEGLTTEFSRLVTEIVTHLRTPEFLESAFQRVAAAHEVKSVANPLQNLDKIAKKPWAYTSGGAMSTLVSCVYAREQPPTESSQWVESGIELAAFYLDTLKALPYYMLKPFLEQRDRSMLAYSPTHAFLVKPGAYPFSEGWQEKDYSFSWVKDQLVIPAERFLANALLTLPMVHHLLDELLMEMDPSFHHLFKKTVERISSGITAAQFRSELFKLLSEDTWVKRLGVLPIAKEQVDSLLYRTLPLFPLDELPQMVNKVISRLPDAFISSATCEVLINALFSDAKSQMEVLTAADLREIVEGLLILVANSNHFPIDIHAEVAAAMQVASLSMPRPLLFADSNWSTDYFGLVVNPGNGEVELWRLDYTGSIGAPLTEWKQWLDGSQKKPWGLYSRPAEYSY